MASHARADGFSPDEDGARPELETPIGIDRAGWMTVLRRAVREIKHDQVTDHAAALTYYGVLSIFPGLLVLVSVLGLVGHSTVNKVLDNVRALAPGGVTTFLKNVIEQVQGRQTSAGLAAIVGTLIALWSASRYVAAFMRAMNRIYGMDEGRPAWQTIPLRLAVTVALVIMLVASAIMVVVTGPIARQVGDAIGIGGAAVTAWNIAKWPVLLIVVSLMFSLLYWATPNVRQPGFAWISGGGLVAVVLWLAVSGLFGVYVSFSSSYNKTYGSLATVIVFLVWLWLTNVAILLGAEFNAETERQRLIEAGLPADVEPFAEPRETRKLPPIQLARVEEAQEIRARSLRP